MSLEYTLKLLWNRGKIAPKEQCLLLSTIFCYLCLDFYVKTKIRLSLQDKQLFEIMEVKITRVHCTSNLFQANGLACMGQYAGDIKSAAADDSLFVAKHAY